MLDDDTSRRVKTLDAFPGRIGIGDVVVAELLALQLLGCDKGAGGGKQVAVQGGLLVRVFTVAQVLQLDKAAIALAGELAQGGCLVIGHALAKLHRRQIVADGAVVLADAVKRRHAQGELGLLRDTAGLELGNHTGVLRSVGEHRHVFPILGRAAYHGRAAYVDVLDGIFQRATGLCHGRFKGVQIDHQQVDGVDLVLGQSGHVRGQFAARQQAAVHARV